MAKGQFWNDTFEQALELGQSTAKASIKAVASTVNPVKIVESVVGLNTANDTGTEKMKSELQKKKNSTPLNFDKLQKTYKEQDALKTQALRSRLFQLVKKGDEESLMRLHQQEQDKIKKELDEEQEKKKRKEEQKKIQDQSSNPKGKIRKSIFSQKKVAQREQVEVRANSGKQ